MPAKSRLLEAGAVFGASLAFLFLLAPSAPFAKELGVCESFAVRDVLAGHIVLPFYGPGSMVEVPPLSLWISAVTVKILGWNEIALRLPALIASAGTCAILFGWLAIVADRRAALWGAAALLLCHFFADAARQPRMDSMLTMFVTAASVALERALAPRSPRRTPLLAVAAALMVLGTMSKGPLGIVLPGLVIALYLIVRGRIRELFAPALLASFAAVIAIVAVWYLAAYRIGGEPFLQWQIYDVLFHRFMSSKMLGRAVCPNPFYYFVPLTLAGFLPWSLFVPAVAVWIWHRRGSLAEPALFALCWFAAIFIFFSSSAGKCFVYILPAFPALAALFGLFAGQRLKGDEGGRLSSRLFVAGCAVVGLAGIALAIVSVAIAIVGLPAKFPIRLHPKDLRYLTLFGSIAGGKASFFLWTLATVAGASATLLGVRRVSVRMQLAGVLVLAAAGTIFWFGTMNPALAELETMKPFAAEVDRIVPQGENITYIGVPDCDLRFYSTHSIGWAKSFTCDPESVSGRYFLFFEDSFRSLAPEQASCLKLAARSAAFDRRGHRLLVTERPATRAAQAGANP